MSAEKSWRLIKHDNTRLPQLIVSTDIRRDGYTVLLSDLEHIWIEQLTKDGILERAQELDCSIDPSQDSGQYLLFSNKLRGAFEQEVGTSLELKSLRSGTNITLLLSVPLPKPWPNLEWEVHLQRQDDVLVRAELTGPLIDRAYALQQQSSQLIAELQAKDHVLSRVIDRLEATGTTLTEIFPNVTNISNRGHSKQQPLREKLAPHIRGLAPFDELAWVSQTGKSGDSASQADVLGEVIPKLSREHGLKISSKPSWWRGLDASIMSAPSRSLEVSSSNLEDSTLRDLPAPPVDDASTDDDDASSQALPSSPPVQSKEDIDTPRKMSSPVGAPLAKPVKKLGAIGGAGNVTPAFVQSSSLPEPSVSPAKPKSKLGAIGGKKDTQEVKPEPQSMGETAVVSPRPKQLGAIGGKRAASEIKQEHETAEQLGLATTDPTTPTRVKAGFHDLSPAEKADHRRDLLKRQQEQAKPVVKKKRRF